MRYLTTFGAVALILALCSPGASCAAQSGLPSGGYAQTCQDIRTRGTTLEARCQTRDNQWNQTSLRDFKQCTGEIENDNGNLVCSKGGNSGQDRHGDQQGDKRDNGQGYRHDDQPGDRRDNGQGDRHDARHDDRNGPPSGGYMQTCRDIQTVGSTLQASCQKRNGKWRQASLRHFDRCIGEIENSNGKLVCSR